MTNKEFIPAYEEEQMLMEYDGLYIPLNHCLHMGLYEGNGRNFDLGVYDVKHHGFWGIRHKWGLVFIDLEFHWDFDDRHGTFKPQRLIEFYNNNLKDKDEIQKYLDYHLCNTKLICRKQMPDGLEKAIEILGRKEADEYNKIENIRKEKAQERTKDIFTKRFNGYRIENGIIKKPLDAPGMY